MNKQESSWIWVTLTELGDIFGKTPTEIGLCLEELGLRAFHTEKHQFLPTDRAHERGLCVLSRTQRRKKGALYLWHKLKVSKLLQEGINLEPLDREDRQDRALALQLLRYCEKNYHSQNGFDPLHDVFRAPTMPTIIAWFVIESMKLKQKLGYFAEPYDIISLLNQDYFHMINYELARLGSEPLNIDHYGIGIHLGDEPEFADCEECLEYINLHREIMNREWPGGY